MRLNFSVDDLAFHGNSEIFRNLTAITVPFCNPRDATWNGAYTIDLQTLSDFLFIIRRLKARVNFVELKCLKENLSKAMENINYVLSSCGDLADDPAKRYRPVSR